MSTSILHTKLHIPSARANCVSRPHLAEALNSGLQQKLILNSAPAGFGKTTLFSSWLEDLQKETASPEQIFTQQGTA